MTTLNFNESRHVYTLTTEDGGEQALPSVSQILQKADMYGYQKTVTNHERMAFGTHVHKLTEMADDGVIGFMDLEDRERGHIEAYEKFKADSELEVIHTEAVIYHPLYLYGAKPDRIAITNLADYPLVLEIKTGQPHPANMLQLSAYHEAYNAMPNSDPKVNWSAAVYLSDDGTYKVVANPDHEKNWSIFLSCIQIVRWKEKYKIGQYIRRNGAR